MALFSGWLLNSKKAPEVVPIITIEKDEFNIQVHHENLQQILDLPQLYKTKVVVIGISGKSQSGKSFLLDVIKLFLQEKVINPQEAGIASRTWKLIAGENDWLTSDKFHKSQIAHFSNYETPTNVKGIYAYKHPLLCKASGDQKVAVIFLDTNGFCGSEFHLDKTIFILMSLICSNHIINIKSNCDDTEFGILSTLENCFHRASEKCDVKLLFPRTTVIVRDSLANNEQLGLVDKNIATEIVTGADKVDKILSSHYRYVKWYLFPTSSPIKDGKEHSAVGIDVILSDKDEMKRQLINLCKDICNPETLPLKSVFNYTMNCHELLRYINKICRLFKRDQKTNAQSQRAALPSSEVLHEGIIMAMCDEGLQALKRDYNLYIKVVQNEVGNEMPEEKLEEVKIIVLRKTVKFMNGFKCAGCTEVVDYYKERACKELLVIHAESTATLIKAENEKLHSEKKQSSEEIESLIQENKNLKESLQNEKDKRKLVEEKLDMVTKELKHEKFEVIKFQKELEDTMQLLIEIENRNKQITNTESKSSEVKTEDGK